MINPASFSSALALSTSSVDWLTIFSNNLTNLTTQNGDALTSIGITELSFISLMCLVKMVVGWSTSGMTLSFYRHPVRAGDLTLFIVRLIVCMLMISYWVNPLPGASFGLNHLFSYLAQMIVKAFDQNALTTMQNIFATASNGTEWPSITEPAKILCYFVAKLILGFASAIVFMITISGYIFYAVCALFGPVFIPLYMSNTLRGKFFHYVDALLSFAMIRAVAAAFIFVWGGFFNAFITQTFNNNYSMDMWLNNLVPCLTIFVAFIINMLYIPSLTQAIFGGGAGMMGRMEASAAGFISGLTG
jgi:type IV secretion system protein VirB6